MENEQQKIFELNHIFKDDYINSKALFLHLFGQIPNTNYVGSIDGEKAFLQMKEKFAEQILSVHTYRWHGTKTRKPEFGETYMVMKNNSIVEFDTDYCEIYTNGTQEEFIDECVKLMTRFKRRARRKPLEINLVSRTRQGLKLKGMEIKKTKLDLDLYYEDDFKETDELICKRLNQQNDEGIVLLHGLPGTGKTTYLRHLVGKIKKRVLFLSPGAAPDMMDPEFIDLMINNSNSVVIIEDAENILMDRKISNNASVSNLLNISDGLLADFLNVQLICTFNNSLTMVDNALMRKGRLIAKYEFGKLGINKSQRLSKHLGFDSVINEPMTIAEIANQHEKMHVAERVEVMGFRRNVEMA